jgi:hypothetical protein
VTATGARYDPSTDTWTATKPVSPSMARLEHSAVWTGSKMIVWAARALRCSVRTSTTARSTAGDEHLAEGRHHWRSGRSLSARRGVDRLEDDRVGRREEFHLRYHRRHLQPAHRFVVCNEYGQRSAGKVDFGTVWTGSQMLVWGGQDPRGARYSRRPTPGHRSARPTRLPPAIVIRLCGPAPR